MLGTSTFVGNTGDGGTSTHDGGGSGGGGGGGSEVVVGPSSMTTGIGDDEKLCRSGGSGGGGGVHGGGSGGDLFEGDRSTGGNRWPRQETIALLQIRSDMDVTFRDSSLKGPLWEEVSRKMGELGYHRSAKKCKEKFENVYKYHKRTKDGRLGKADGKTYRFFEQLEALEQHHQHLSSSTSLLPPLPQPPPQVPPFTQSHAPPQAAVPVSMVIPAGSNPINVTVPSSSPHPINIVHTTSIGINTNSQQQLAQSVQQQPHVTGTGAGYQTHSSIQIETNNASSPSATQSTSSRTSTSSGEEMSGRRKRKRKWKDFFEKLMKEVIDKQEELQKKFLEAVERREHERAVREDAWKKQEIARLNREHDILAQERSMAAAKDTALINFLQKLSDQQKIPFPLPIQAQAQAQAQAQHRPAQPSQPQPKPQPQINAMEINPMPPPVPPQPRPEAPPVTPPRQQSVPNMEQAIVVVNTNNNRNNGDFENSNNGENLLQASSSRWPKAEVEALINLRTNLDQKYQENGPKGPLWEEISLAMKKIGYNRNAKRCKEKWENINKYFKKVKESNKKRPEDSKTCPYFHQLDALYREKNKMEISNTTINTSFNVQGSISSSMAPIIAQPEQQWPPLLQRIEDQGSENHDDSDDDGDDDEDDDDHGSGYEIVANNNNNNVNAGSIE